MWCSSMEHGGFYFNISEKKHENVSLIMHLNFVDQV